MVWIYYIPEEWNIRSKRKQGVRKCRLWRHLCVKVRTYGGRGGERGHEVARAARGHSERRVGLNFIFISFLYCYVGLKNSHMHRILPTRALTFVFKV